MGGGGHVRICGPTTQVPTSVHFWADAHGCRDREGELERGRGGGLPPFTLSSFMLEIKPKGNNIRGETTVTSGELHFCCLVWNQQCQTFTVSSFTDMSHSRLWMFYFTLN